MRGISKRFPGVLALSDVALDVRAGEVLALMGENGAGKSTLMKVLGGVLAPDAGEIRIDDAKVVLDGVRAARQHGVALIHQELMLAPNLDIASNIFLGNERKRNLWRPLERGEMNRRAAALLQRIGLALPPTTPVSTLTTGQQQMVEVAKALSVESRVIVMDEPTSSLAAAESEQLFAIVRQLRKDGIGIIYISHRMEEVLALADRISVLRDGCNAGELLRADASHDKIVALMVGRELSGAYFPAKTGAAPGDVMLDVTDLRVPGAPEGVSFGVRRGEILGFAGLVGSGRTELMETLFGVVPARGGSMTVEGRPFAPRRPRDAIERGVYLVPEDRKRNGLVLPMSVAENASLPSIGQRARFGLVDRRGDNRLADAEVARLRIKTPSIQQKVVTLSGGNQQKIVIGKWLAMNPKVLILDEPTRGVDVGAKAEIYRHMADLAAQGIAILMVSSDMEEVIGMSDRVIVMHERRLKGVLTRAELTQEGIAALMTGQRAAGDRAAQ
ncbi:MAG TPA: sugar ABC transporter ATP-binding protein [Polyangiaceae bacterium]|jgi:ribose transport system ATP-binding protein|nr:sugar ABC transporter ATP-binding protein [Polyangiaceae bacterium]